ncbi:MAG TPA: MASE3 domain-containing protein [Nitrospirota bacterium]|nr:MASE3 domain-containing protein [Nitrospirota bacterium]
MVQTSHSDTSSRTVVSVISGLLIAGALYASSLYSYLLFHSLLELFNVLTAFVIFILAWHTRRIQDNRFLLFIGISSLSSGALDLAHALSYKGMGIFTGYSSDLPTQLWIAFRYVASLSFLVAPFFLKRAFPAGKVLGAYGLLTVILLFAIFSGLFPSCFIEGSGLTTFKIASEYIIIFFFLASLVLLIRQRELFDRAVFRLMVAAAIAAVLSELAFTRYVSVFGPANMIGHFFLLVSTVCIYRAFVVTGVAEPSRVLFRDLKLSEEALQKARDESELRVRERTAELARANEELEEEIRERRHAEESLRRLNEELEQRVTARTSELEAANRELEAFSYSVSHDLKAPLRSIDGFAQAIEEEQSGRMDDSGRNYLRRVRMAAGKMSQLIDALLNLSRQSRGEMRPTSVDLSRLAKGIAEEFAKSQPGRMSAFIIPDGITAEGDPVMLRAVLENLLGNAWKFTGRCESPRIEFGTMQSNGSVVYFVRDNGAGFDMAYADRLFKAFQRLHSAEEFFGIGIGLATVQRIIHRHGGRIWAEGEVGQGAVFYFTL